MKARITFILVGAVLASCGTVSTIRNKVVSQAAMVSVNSLTLSPDGVGVVTISLTSVEAVGTVSIALAYDPTLVCVADCRSNPTTELVAGYCQTMSNDQLFQNAPNTSLVKLTISSEVGGFSGDAVLGTLTLRAMGPLGSFDLVPQVIAYVGPAPLYTQLPVDIRSGKVTIAEKTPTPVPTTTPTRVPTPTPTAVKCCGDSDVTGSVSTAEATQAILALVNRDPALAIAAQCTSPGQITTADVTKVILNLVNRTCLGGATP